MNLSDWIQDNWYELASVVVQFGILIVVAWYGRARLQLLKGSERHQLSAAGEAEIAETLSYAPPEREAAPAGFAGVGRMLSARPDLAADTASEMERAPRPRRKAGNALRAIVRWLQEPMRA